MWPQDDKAHLYPWNKTTKNISLTSTLCSRWSTSGAAPPDAASPCDVMPSPPDRSMTVPFPHAWQLCAPVHLGISQSDAPLPSWSSPLVHWWLQGLAVEKDKLHQMCSHMSLLVFKVTEILDKLQRICSHMSLLVFKVTEILDKLQRICSHMSLLVFKVTEILDKLQRICSHMSLLVFKVTEILDKLQRICSHMSLLVFKVTEILKQSVSLI